MKLILTGMLACFLGLPVAHAATQGEMLAGKSAGQSIGIKASTGASVSGAEATTGSVTGAGGYESSGDPSRGGVTGAKGTATYPYPVDCDVTRTKYIGGIGVKYGICPMDSAGNATSVPFSVCTKSQGGAVCASSDWTGYQTVNVGGSGSFAGGKVTIKVASCTGSVCQVSLVDNDQASGTGADLGTQGAAKAAAEGDGLAASADIAYGNPAFHSAMRGVGTQLSGCYTNNVADTLDSEGKVYTCDGQQSGSFNNECVTVTECLSQHTTTRNWDETCEAEIPLTTQNCKTTTPTVDCNEELKTTLVTCSNTLSVVCLADAGPETVPLKPILVQAWWCDNSGCQAGRHVPAFVDAAQQAGNTVTQTQEYKQTCYSDSEGGSWCTGGVEYKVVATGGAPVSVAINTKHIGTGRTFIFQIDGNYGSLSIDGKVGVKHDKPYVYYSAQAQCADKVWKPGTKDYPGHWACPTSTGTTCPSGTTATVINGSNTCIGPLTYTCTDTWTDGCLAYK
jgi:hypothetical protein